MILNSLFFQIVLTGLAVAIAVIYVQPAFADIGTLQDAIVKYKNERDHVTEVNAKLATLAEKIGNIPKEDQSALLIYMPDKIDEVAVSRDIYNISLMSNANISDINIEESSDSTERKAEDGHRTLPVPHVFNVNLTGSYDQLKTFVQFLEQSNYPLEVHNLTLTSSENEGRNILQAEINIVTYSRI